MFKDTIQDPKTQIKQRRVAKHLSDALAKMKIDADAAEVTPQISGIYFREQFDEIANKTLDETPILKEPTSPSQTACSFSEPANTKTRGHGLGNTQFCTRYLSITFLLSQPVAATR